MKHTSLLLQWLHEGKVSPFCKSCVHFLRISEPRVVSQLIVFPRDSLRHGTIEAGRCFRSDSVCNECFYNALGQPSNYHGDKGGTAHD